MENKTKYIVILSVLTICMIIQIIRLVSQRRGHRGERREGRVMLNSNFDARASEEFGPCTYYANTRHGQRDNCFQFLYRHVGREWRIYILRMPSLGHQNGSLHLTHRYRDSNNNYWICRDPQPTNLKDAQSLSRLWADRELEYIATGIEFDNQNWG